MGKSLVSCFLLTHGVYSLCVGGEGLRRPIELWPTNKSSLLESTAITEDTSSCTTDKTGQNSSSLLALPS